MFALTRRFISVQHEQNAVHMADGFSRATGKTGIFFIIISFSLFQLRPAPFLILSSIFSGKTGVCIAQNGPGITNFVTGVAAAFWAHR